MASLNKRQVCLLLTRFTINFLQMDRDEKGKQGGWSNPNYEVTEGKLGLNFDFVRTMVSLFVCLSVHLLIRFFLQSCVKLCKVC